MDNLPESITNLFLSGLIGAISGLISVPINLLIASKFKKDELYYQHKLEIIAKQRELLLQHKLEMKKQQANNSEISSLQEKISELEKIVSGKSNE